VQTNFRDELHVPEPEISSYKYGSENASFLIYSSGRMHLQEVLKMSSMRLNTCLGMSYHGLLNLFKDPGIVADSLMCSKRAGELYPCCKQDLNAERLFIAPAHRNSEDSNQVSVGAM
jgi:hypothetical protein